jgi:hypothetical protein
MTARHPLRSLSLTATLLVGLVASPTSADAQTAPPAPAAAVQPDGIHVATGVEPDTVTVGQPYRAVARITVPARSRVEVSLVPADSEAVEVSAPVSVDTTAAAQGTWGATVGLVAWKTGAGTPVSAILRVTSAAGATREVSFPFAAPFVRSVLPKDTTGLKPKGPKDVLDAKFATEHVRRLLGIGGIVIALLALLAYALLKLLGKLRRRRAEEQMDPRQRALAALDRAAAAGLLERGDLRAFYVEVSDAVRGLAAALSPRWGGDLTTSELSDRMRADDVPEADRRSVLGILDRADLAKFARLDPPADVARGDLAAAREWVSRIQAPQDGGDEPVELSDAADAEMAGSAR